MEVAASSSAAEPYAMYTSPSFWKAPKLTTVFWAISSHWLTVFGGEDAAAAAGHAGQQRPYGEGCA